MDQSSLSTNLGHFGSKIQTTPAMIPLSRIMNPMARSSAPVFVIVPGGFTHPSAYADVQAKLQAASYDVEVVSLITATQSVSEHILTMHDDARRIHCVIQKHVDHGRDIILVMHSYGGVPGTEATNHLGRAARQEKNGLPGGVIELVYLAACVAAEGEASSSLYELDSASFPTFKKGWLYHDNSDLLAEWWYNDVSRDRAKELSRIILPQAAQPASDNQTYAGWKDIPATYIHTSMDKIVPMAAQRTFVDKMKTQSRHQRDVQTFSLEAGHCPHQTCPEDVANILIRIAASLMNET